MCSDCEPLIKAIDAFLQKADNNLSGELTSEGYASGKKTVKAINKLEDGIADVLQEETKYITNEAKKADSLQDFSINRWASVKQADNTSEKLSRTFRDEFTEFMPGIIDNYIQQTDRELHLESISEVTTAWIRDWSGQLGEMMQLTSHDEIENILVDGLEKGIGIPEFTQQIMDSGIRDEQYRARTTALTEVLRAHSVAQQEAFSQSPSVTKKMWRHTGSYRNTPRPNHVDMDRQVVHTEDAFFMEGIYGGYYYPDYPRDPSLPPEETINCHCLMEPVADVNILGLSLEERQELQRQAVEELNEGWEEEHPNEEAQEAQEEAEPEKTDEEKIKEGTEKLSAAMSEEDYNAYVKLLAECENGDIKALYEEYGDGVRAITYETDAGSYAPATNSIKFSYRPERNVENGMSRYEIVSHEYGHYYDAKVEYEGLTHKEIDTISSKSEKLDRMFSPVASNSDQFLAATREDCAALKTMYEADNSAVIGDLAFHDGSSGIQDALMGYTGETIRWGHDEAYYNRKYNDVKWVGAHKELKEAYKELGIDASNQAKVKQQCRIYETASELWANLTSAETCGGQQLEYAKKYMPKSTKVLEEIIGKAKK